MKRPNLYDRLKVIAILTMIVDHIGYSFFPEISWLRLIGRIAFPIFLFLVGFNESYRWRWDLLGFAVAIQIPMFVLAYRFGFGSRSLNILRGIIIGRVVLNINSPPSWINKFWILPSGRGNSKLKSLILIVTTILLLLIHPWLAGLWDYGSFVVLFPLMGFLFRNAKHGQFFNLLYAIILFAALGFFSQQVFGFDVVQLFILGGFYVLLLCIFFVLGQGNRFLPVGEIFDRGLLFLSKNALLIYVFHLLMLGIIKIFLMRR